MLKHCLAFALAFAATSVCNAAPADEKALSNVLTRQMEINAQRYGIVGQAVLVARNGETLFRGANGVADIGSGEKVSTEHVFAVYSVAKLFASVLIMQLVEAGTLNLDMPIETYLSEIPKSWYGITVRNFINHTSGIPDYFDVEQFAAGTLSTKQAAFTKLAGKPMQFPTGSTTRYNQTNFLVLSALLEKHYGKPYQTIVSERILKKLKLSHTYLGQENAPHPGTVTNYSGKQGTLQEDAYINWPSYSVVHANLYTTIDDLATYLNAVADGQLVGKATLQTQWQPTKLSNGQPGMFSTGWEYERSGDYQLVGHDGGTKVRVRLLFTKLSGGDVFTLVYLTNGSLKNVWSRLLTNSVMAVIAPEKFPNEVLSEALLSFASGPTSTQATTALIQQLREAASTQGIDIEPLGNNSGYAIRENLGIAQAIRVFELNTTLFPQSANAWDSLAEAYAAQGDQERSKALYNKAAMLAGKKTL